MHDAGGGEMLSASIKSIFFTTSYCLVHGYDLCSLLGYHNKLVFMLLLLSLWW
jgi:hypothetical protein